MPFRQAIKGVLHASGYDLLRWPACRRDVFSHILELVERFNIDCVLDVGANLGQFALELREVGYQGKIISFEPVSKTFEQLSRSVSKDPQWEAHRLALGEEDSSLEINVLEKTNLSTFLTPNESCVEVFQQDATIVEKETVAVKRLDSIIGELLPDLENTRVLLKLDTQGFDAKVIRGARNCFQQFCALQTEVAIRRIYDGMPPFTEALQELTETGFDFSGIFPVHRDQQLRLTEVDCVLINPAFY